MSPKSGPSVSQKAHQLCHFIGWLRYYGGDRAIAAQS
jgi:hypothetical protein